MTTINFSFTHPGVMQNSTKLKRQTKTMRAVIPTLVSCDRYFMTGDDGRPRCNAVIPLHWGSAMKAKEDKRYCQLDPGQITVWVEWRDIRTRTVTITHFICLSDRLLEGEYRLVEGPVDSKST